MDQNVNLSLFGMRQSSTYEEYLGVGSKTYLACDS